MNTKNSICLNKNSFCLLQDHIAEVVAKWENVDDEIWAKMIIFERNRRVAKAYARSAVLTINGSDAGFNGLNIGVNGFENPRRDMEVADCKAAIGAGCKLKMTENGDILIKRVGKGKVFIQNILPFTLKSFDVLLHSNKNNMGNLILLSSLESPFPQFQFNYLSQT